MSSVIPRIAVDAMGSDLGPEEVVAGVKSVIKADRSPMEIIIVGNEEILTPLLMKYSLIRDRRVKVYHAGEVIGMEEKPIQAIKTKKDASMLRAIEMVKIGMADSMLSCGNTGALMAAGTLKLRPMCGIERPALGTIIPGKKKCFVMVDVGASPDPKPDSMVDNGILGANYARVVLGVKNPKIGLLSNGTEDGKGNVLTQRAHKLFKENDTLLNYCGLIEGFNLFDGDCDVVVCDGFTGNVVLKSMESAVSFLKGLIKEEAKRNWLRMLGMCLASGTFKSIKKRLPVEKISGAPLLGLNGLVVKAHGGSNRLQIAGALEIAIKCLKMDMNRRIAEDVEKIRPDLVEEKRAKLAAKNAAAAEATNQTETSTTPTTK